MFLEAHRRLMARIAVLSSLFCLLGLLALVGMRVSKTTAAPVFSDFANGNLPMGGVVGSIGDTIFHDANGNGVQDSSELGLPGVVVNLFNNAGATRMTTTDVNGNYLFPELPFDTYTIKVDVSTLPADKDVTPTADPDGGADNVAIVVITPNIPDKIDNMDQDFGYAPLRTPVPKFTDTPTPKVTDTPNPQVTNTPISDITSTPTPKITDTPHPIPTDTPISDITKTATPRATDTPNPQITNTPISDITSTPTPKITDTPHPIPTDTPISDITNTPTPRATDTPNPQITNTPISDITKTATPNPQVTKTPIMTNTPAPTPTRIIHDWCHVGWDVHINPAWDHVTVYLQIGNDSPMPEVYDVSVAALPGLSPITTFTMTPTSPITLTGYAMAELHISPVPTTTTSGPYEVSVTNQATGNVFTCNGQIWSPSNNYWLDAPTGGIVQWLTIGGASQIVFPIHNTSDQPLVADFAIEAMADVLQRGAPARSMMDLISLDGLPAGTNVTGTITIPPGGTGEVPVDVTLLQDVPIVGDVILYVDVDQDGVWDSASSATILSRSAVPTAVTMRSQGVISAESVTITLSLLLITAFAGVVAHRKLTAHRA